MKVLEQKPPKRKKGQSDEDYQAEIKAFENYQFQIGLYAARLEQERAKKEIEIREQNLQKQLDLSRVSIDNQYAEDFAKYQDNEAKKTKHNSQRKKNARKRR